MAIQVEDYEELKDYYRKLQQYFEVDELRTVDHSMTKSIYINDPDGNGIELFCNTFDTAEEGPRRDAPPRPPEHRAGLRLDRSGLLQAQSFDFDRSTQGRVSNPPLSLCNPSGAAMIRAAAIDLDGTIIGPDELITPAVLDAVARLSAHIPVFIATGREPQDVYEYSRELGLTGPQLSDGGAAILDPVARRHIWSANLGPELASEVLALIGELGSNFVATHGRGTFRRVTDIPDREIVRISALDLSRQDA